ncbi:MAG: UDP-N-acetylmuramoyl-tripeptide--D-alanyl-D-alanine ligase, partial [Lachnospiraceae bacterium]|nr:UDP-N-acetylmuramoyl-tripeptide--D-alanyl-D-alanine ligase [Lachnospiraceae bacterium]
CEKEPEDCAIPYILVDSSFKALMDIASFYRDNLTIPVIGITGSVGKTSTKEFIAATLATKYRVCKTEGNFNNEVGMPLTILSIREEHEIAVIEMGISDFGEMTRLASVSKPDACVITNIGKCHLEKLGNRDGVLKAKTEMFAYLDHDGAIFLNGDDDRLINVKKPWNRDIQYFGMQETNDIYASDVINKGLLGSDAVICYRKGDREGSLGVHIPIPGDHMVYNALASVAVGLEYGLSEEQIIRGIASVSPTSGRSNILSTPSYTLIDDCYNANPVSVKAAIDLLSKADSRKVAILGDMFELGKDEEKLHYSIGEYVFLHGIDVLVSIGKLSVNMYDAAVKGANGNEHKKVYHFDTKEEAINALPEILRKDDAILVKASHGMHFENIVEYLKTI